MEYQYSYLFMGIFFLVIWLSLFLWRKKTRKEMLIMSLIFSVAGPLADIIYTRDWWHPLTITNTRIGFEALLVAFAIGGIASVLYIDLFKKRYKTKKRKKNINFLFILSLAFIVFAGGFYLLKLNSFIATILALSIPTIIIWIKRKDLIRHSFISGILLLGVAVIVYSLVEIITPGWVHEFWFFKNVPEIILLNLPLDDILWYFFAGLFIGPLYEYWQERKALLK